MRARFYHQGVLVAKNKSAGYPDGMKWWVLASLVACGLPEEGLLVTTEDAGADVVTQDVTVQDVVEEDTVVDVPVMLDAPPDAPVITAGSALQFIGGSYVDMGNIPIPADFTLEAWVRPGSANNETYVVAEDERNQGNGQFRFGLANGGKLFFLMSDAAGSSHGLYNNGYQLQTAAAIAIGVWTHVAVVKSGASFLLAVNGASAATVTADASFVHGGPAVNFRVAARVDTNGIAPNGGFDGIIDEVRLWNIARALPQIAQTMSMEVAPSSAGLFTYWRFDEGSGLNAGDQKTGYPGTLVSNPTWVKSTAF
jgi:hypothetical protein